MKENLLRMQHAITEWMIKDELLGDGCFIPIEEWRSRGESLLEDAELILAIDGCSLHGLLNLGGDTTEFDDLIESFGFWYELGHTWSVGFHSIDDYDFTPTKGSYANKLQDPRWRRKANLVKDQANHRCQDCGSADQLDAHHCYYTNMRQGFEPWEYPLSAFRALCRQCHTTREREEIRMRAFCASLTHSELAQIRAGLHHAHYWFTPTAVSDFLSFISPEAAHLQKGLEILKQGKKDTD